MVINLKISPEKFAQSTTIEQIEIEIENYNWLVPIKMQYLLDVRTELKKLSNGRR